MGFFDHLLGRRNRQAPHRMRPRQAARLPARALTDDEAIQRYRYMLRTAPPEAIEQAHEEAFARLTPAQRAQVLRELLSLTPEREQTAWRSATAEPRTLARLATRAELRQPGIMERMLAGPGSGMGGMMAGTIFGSLVAGFVGSMIAHEFFEHTHAADWDGGGTTDGGSDEQFLDAQEGDYLNDAEADAFDDVGGDFGGEF